MKHKQRLMLYKIIIIIFLIAAFVWPRFLTQDAEIDNRALAIAIGVDVNNDDDRGEVLASAQILVPVPQGQQVGKQEVFFGTGRTLAEALSYINVKIGRILDFGQVGLIVFGEEKARNGVLHELKYLINNKVRAESSLFVASECEAREALQKANSLTEEATSSLNNLLKFNAQSTYMPNINLLQFISDSSSTDKSSFIPILNINSRDSITLSDGSKTDKTIQTSSTSDEEGGGDEELNEIKDVDRVYLFKDGKAIDKLNNTETRGLVWHNKDAYFGIILAEDVLVGNTILKYLPCDLREKSVKSSVAFENGVPTITYKFKLRFNSEDLHEVNENQDSTLPFEKSKINASIKTSLERVLRNDVETCFQKLREKDIDALRIRHQFYKFCHSEYNRHISKNPRFLDDVTIKYSFNIKLY